MKGPNVSAPLHQLVERRLWPLAVLLLAALLAVPVLLAKSSEPAPVSATPAPATSATAPAVAEPVVALADASRTDRKRNVLGAAKDPFRPARAPRAEQASEAEQVQTTVTSGTSSPAPSSGTGGTEPGGSKLPTPPPPAPLEPVAPEQPVYETYSLRVRFGDRGTELPARNLKRLASLPSADDATVIYLGQLKDRRTALFLVDAGAVVQGDGVCEPSPTNCQTLRLRKGDTAYFDVADGSGAVRQYRLDVVRVVTKRTTSAEDARRLRRAVAKGGREALRTRLSRTGGYRYNPRTGTVHRASSTN